MMDKTKRALWAILASPALWLLIGVVLPLSALVPGCGKESVQRAVRPALVASPSAIVFGQAAVGSTDSVTVWLANEGDATLSITEWDLQGPEGVFSVSGLEVLPLLIEPGEEASITVTHSPLTADRSTGYLGLVHNGTGDDRIDLATQALAGRVFVSPNPIDFGRVPEGAVATEAVEVQNIGTSDLDLGSVTVISPSGEFEIDLEDQQAFSAAVLEPGDSILVDLTYAPLTAGYDDGVLVVRSNDPNDPEFRVPIQANGAEPCISVTHEEGYSFGQRQTGRTHEEVFTVTNCSTASNGEALIVDAITWSPNLDPSPSFGLASLPGLPLTIEPEGTATFVVTYAPEIEGDVERALLRISSNDEIKSPLDIEITGTGSDNTCPTAVATCVIRDSGAPPSTEISALPLDVLDCTSAASTDPDGDIIERVWQVVERPEGSTASFDDPSAESPSLFLDLAGRYALELDLVDDDGSPACEPARVVVVATPDEDIHVQLVWTTPADPDETDEGFAAGTDVDLHLLHPNGCWEERPWDCHWRDTQPNWGDTSRTDDDPSLDIDDTDGAGPENINLDNPEAGITYRVGVHYYNDHGFGTSIVTARIYLFGTLVYEDTQEMTDRGQFWQVAEIDWPTGAVRPIGAVTGDIPTCP